MDYNQMEVLSMLERQNNEKYQKFMERISQFKEVTTLEEAKELAKQILPTHQELSRFLSWDKYRRSPGRSCHFSMRKDRECVLCMDQKIH